jgi:hypothetical protein
MPLPLTDDKFSFGLQPYREMQEKYYNLLHNKNYSYEKFRQIVSDFSEDLGLGLSTYEKNFFAIAFTVFQNSLRGRGILDNNDRDSNVLHSISACIMFKAFIEKKGLKFKAKDIINALMALALHDIGEIIAEIATHDNVHIDKIITKPEKDEIEAEVFKIFITAISYLAQTNNFKLINQIVKEIIELQKETIKKLENGEKLTLSSIKNTWQEVFKSEATKELKDFLNHTFSNNFDFGELLNSRSEFYKLLNCYRKIENREAGENPIYPLAKLIEKIQGFAYYDEGYDYNLIKKFERYLGELINKVKDAFQIENDPSSEISMKSRVDSR